MKSSFWIEEMNTKQPGSSMEEESGKLTLTKRKTVKFSNLFLGHNFCRFFDLSQFLSKALHKGRAWSARNPGPKLERLATLVMIFIV